MAYRTTDTMNVMYALGASNMTIGKEDDSGRPRSENLTTTKNPAACAAGKIPKDDGRRPQKEKEEKRPPATGELKSDGRRCRRKTAGVSDPSDSSMSSVDLNVDPKLRDELLELIDQLQTDVYETRTDYEERRLRKSSVGTFAYTDGHKETMDDELRNLEFGLQRLQFRAEASKGLRDEVLNMLSMLDDFKNDYELVKIIHVNAKTRARLEKRLRKRRLDEEALFGRDTDGATGSWIANNMCWPCRVLYRLFFGNPAKTR